MIPHFHAHTIWTHERFMDVMVYILKVGYRGKTNCKLKVQWFNTRGMDLRITQNIRIESKQYPYWRRVA
jgi:hypothetical protein